MDLPGFDKLIATCRALAIDVRFHPPATEIPDLRVVLGQPLDPQLAAVLARSNGLSLRGRSWVQRIYGFGEPDDLIEHNGLLRRLRDDLPRLSDFMIFGQMGFQARLPATIPALAAADGTQPVVDVDLDEDLRIVPFASSVDRALGLRARHLERAGSEEGCVDLRFPWDVPDLAAEDAAFVAAIEAGAFQPYLTGDRDTVEFLERVRAAARAY